MRSVIELLTHKIGVHTSWQWKGMNIKWVNHWWPNGTTYVTVVCVVHGKGWTVHMLPFQVVEGRSVMNDHECLMGWRDAPTESANWTKRGQYQINRRWNGITNCLRIQIVRNEVNIELAAEAMAWRTAWEFKLVEAMSISNWQEMQWHYALPES